MQGSVKLAKVLAVTSGGGHWDEMMILAQDLADLEIVYANTFAGLGESAGIEKCYLVAECNRDTPLSVLACARDIWRILTIERPGVIISTGAAPGIIAIVLGRMRGCRTVWVDSVANSLKLSLSGRIAGSFAHVWLTQWEHLARRNGPYFWGSVL